MQALGWISIITGLLYFRKVSGLLLIIIGIAVVYVIRKSKKNESELTRSVFQEQIKRIKDLKKVLKIGRQESKSDFLTASLPTINKIEPDKEKKQKTDWFIYKK